MDREKIRKDGLKLIDEFSEMLKEVKETDETHYVVDLKNVTRDDGKPERKKEFREKMRRIAPRWEDNHVIAEKGRKE
ncbi:MAG: Asp-tRNA(Asn) amidotransferase GatCAB subunit C [Candidatus Altiarchaeales archaeon ex4484_2]|nr:MAG: Asp-tRNA(Asn) amidotransferase GatCAB subunit C [Candidatus Altiarchaeales archaeon ex4484_2]